MRRVRVSSLCSRDSPTPFPSSWPRPNECCRRHLESRRDLSRPKLPPKKRREVFDFYAHFGEIARRNAPPMFLTKRPVKSFSSRSYKFPWLLSLNYFARIERLAFRNSKISVHYSRLVKASRRRRFLCTQVRWRK